MPCLSCKERQRKTIDCVCHEKRHSRQHCEATKTPEQGHRERALGTRRDGLDLLDALMAQIDLNRRLEAGRKAISGGDGIVADATYFASLRDRALRRVS